MGVLGPASDGSVVVGYEFPTQILTVNGSPSGGTVAMRYVTDVSTSWAYNAASSTVQTAVRTIAKFASATVSGSAGGPWTVTFNADAGVPELVEIVNALTGGSTPYVAVTGTAIPIELKYRTAPSEVAIPPLAGKTFIPGTSSERQSQVKVSQYVIEAPIYLGRFEMKESERVDQAWYSNLRMIDTKTGITLAPLKTAATLSGGAVGNHTAITEHLGYVVGLEYTGNINHFATATWTYQTNVGTTLISSPVTRYLADAIGYGTYVFLTTSTSAQGYTYYNPATATGTSVTAANNSPAVAFCILDGKLFRIQQNGQIGWTIDGTTEASWVLPSTAKIPDGSSPYSMAVYAHPKTGNNTIYILTSSGLWLFDYENAYAVSRLFHENIAQPSTGYHDPGRLLTVHQGYLYVCWRNTVRQWDGANFIDIGPGDGLIALVSINGTTISTGAPTYTVGLLSVGKYLYLNMMVFGVSTLYQWDGRGWNQIGRETTENWPGMHYYINAAGTTRRVLVGRNYWDINEFGDPVNFATAGTAAYSGFDRGMSDIDKVAYSADFFAKALSATETITPYYTLDNATTSTASGSDPYQHWVRFLDKDGSNLTINSTSVVGGNGRVRGYFDRQTAIDGSTKYSQGRRYQTIWIRTDLAGAGSTASPILKSVVVNLDAVFDTLKGWTTTLDLSAAQPNGKTAEWVFNTVRELAEKRLLFPFAWRTLEHHIVRLDSYQFLDPATGNVITGGAHSPYLQIVVSERLRD
jgi:hypothetical protein